MCHYLPSCFDEQYWKDAYHKQNHQQTAMPIKFHLVEEVYNAVLQESRLLLSTLGLLAMLNMTICLQMACGLELQNGVPARSCPNLQAQAQLLHGDLLYVCDAGHSRVTLLSAADGLWVQAT